jgi:ribosome maturation factor RimP
VKTLPPLELIEGVLITVDEEALVLATSDGERRVPRSDVASARTVVDWDAELRKAER